jgi:hypothetical protein
VTQCNVLLDRKFEELGKVGEDKTGDREVRGLLRRSQSSATEGEKRPGVTEWKTGRHSWWAVVEGGLQKKGFWLEWTMCSSLRLGQ